MELWRIFRSFDLVLEFLGRIFLSIMGMNLLLLIAKYPKTNVDKIGLCFWIIITTLWACLPMFRVIDRMNGEEEIKELMKKSKSKDGSV